MKFCVKCGNQCTNETAFCPKCGNPMNAVVNMNNNNNNNNKNIIANKTTIILIVVLVVVGIFSVSLIAVSFSSSGYYISSENQEYYEEYDTTSGNTATSPGKTSIVTDNKYKNESLNSSSDVFTLIEEDSISQKGSCPADIIAIENEIIQKYNIEAVNLCEIDIEFARELIDVIGYVYDEYPVLRDEITNFTVVNVDGMNGYVAAFMPVFPFATGVDNGYPVGIKTQILLNTSYFFNLERLEKSVEGGSKSGHFPPNATVYSPVVHEFGHYLSYLAMLNYNDIDPLVYVTADNFHLVDDAITNFFGDDSFSEFMINEAFENYKKDTSTTMDIISWRGTISQYALAKDNNNNYIYDETIAEAFHDVYLNNDQAVDASKYVVEVVKKYLEE